MTPTERAQLQTGPKKLLELTRELQKEFRSDDFAENLREAAVNFRRLSRRVGDRGLLRNLHSDDFQALADELDGWARELEGEAANSQAHQPPVPTLRQLTREDVVFVVTIEAEETPVEGNFMHTDDAEADRADEDELLKRLDSGDVAAWCVVVVTARWTAKSGRVHTGTASLGCCALTDTYTARICAEEQELDEKALERLNEHVAALVSHGRELAAELAV